MHDIQRFPAGALVLLAAGLFVASTSEFLPVALLSTIAEDLGVGVGAVGQLVTVFAISLVVFSIPLASATRFLPPKLVLLGSMAGIACSAILSGSAPDFTVLLIARVIGGAMHALCAATTVAMMSSIVRKEHMGRAVAITTAGGTLTFILGIPGSAALGDLLGWRAAFLLSAASLLAVAAVLARLLPAIGPSVDGDSRPAAPSSRVGWTWWLRDPELQVLFAVSLLAVTSMAGHFALYTYVNPWMTRALGIADHSLPIVLFIFGAASGLGLLIATPLADLAPRRVFVACAALVGVAVGALAMVPASTVVVVLAIAVWGFAQGGIPGILQAKLMRTASPRNRHLAGALQAMGGNVGVALGSVVGALVAGWQGIAALPWLLVSCYVAILLVVVVDGATSARRGPAAESPG
ncbi:MFS transporter [Agromyces tropicus]|uniref:MFS transporter n=1 Tax=Agromyces tropicus TaxID=555371 RepID=A0ABP5GBW0_9MICO